MRAILLIALLATTAGAQARPFKVLISVDKFIEFLNTYQPGLTP